MTIVIAENFQNDTPESILRRYPGSIRTSPDVGSDLPYTFPLANYCSLQFGIVPFVPGVNTRFEVRIEYDQQPEKTGNLTRSLHIFGVTFELVAGQRGVEYMGRNMGSFPSARALNIIMDATDTPDEYYMTVVIDEKTVYPKTLTRWMPTSWVGILSEETTPGYVSGSLPCYISSIVAAVDTQPDTRIHTSSFTRHNLTVIDSGDWAFSGAGFVEDVDKHDPTVEEPNVSTSSTATLTYGISNYDAEGFFRAYTAGYTESSEHALSINGAIMALGAAPQATRTIPIDGGEVSLAVVETHAPYNDDGLIFYGEAQPISYEDLCTAVGFTEGDLTSNDDKWLHFNLDGRELYVAMTPVRHGISWNQLYDAGLVFGQEGPGIHSGDVASKSQDTTVTIDGKVYSVRLLSGAITNPANHVSSTAVPRPFLAIDSEWNRLFSPISNYVFTDQGPGPKLADYSNESLGMADQNANGSLSWTQNVAYIDDNLVSDRIVRGGFTVADTAWKANSSADSNLGWRPVLELKE